LLTELHLAGASYPPVHEHQPLISFAEIPSLIEIIGSHLTRLRILHIALKGFDSAESVCRGRLRPDMLSRRGTIAQMRVVADSLPTPIFSVLRVFSVLQSTEGSLENDTPKFVIRPQVDHAPFISYLRS
jgi:hypothetical protein